MFKMKIGGIVYFPNMFTEELHRGIYRGIESVAKDHGGGYVEYVPYLIIDPLDSHEGGDKVYDQDSSDLIRMSPHLFEDLTKRYTDKIRSARTFIKPKVSKDTLQTGIYIAQGHQRFG